MIAIVLCLFLIPTVAYAQACGDNSSCVGATLLDRCADTEDTSPHIVTNFKVRLHDGTDNVYTDVTLELVSKVGNTNVYAAKFTDVNLNHIYAVRYHHGGEFLGLWSSYVRPPTEHYLTRAYNCLMFIRYAPLVINQPQ